MLCARRYLLWQRAVLVWRRSFTPWCPRDNALQWNQLRRWLCGGWCLSGQQLRGLLRLRVLSWLRHCLLSQGRGVTVAKDGERCLCFFFVPLRASPVCPLHPPGLWLCLNSSLQASRALLLGSSSGRWIGSIDAPFSCLLPSWPATHSNTSGGSSSGVAIHHSSSVCRIWMTTLLGNDITCLQAGTSNHTSDFWATLLLLAMRTLPLFLSAAAAVAAACCQHSQHFCDWVCFENKPTATHTAEVPDLTFCDYAIMRTRTRTSTPSFATHRTLRLQHFPHSAPPRHGVHRSRSAVRCGPRPLPGVCARADHPVGQGSRRKHRPGCALERQGAALPSRGNRGGGEGPPSACKSPPPPHTYTHPTHLTYTPMCCAAAVLGRGHGLRRRKRRHCLPDHRLLRHCQRSPPSTSAECGQAHRLRNALALMASVWAWNRTWPRSKARFPPSRPTSTKPPPTTRRSSKTTSKCVCGSLLLLVLLLLLLLGRRALGTGAGSRCTDAQCAALVGTMLFVSLSLSLSVTLLVPLCVRRRR